MNRQSWRRAWKQHAKRVLRLRRVADLPTSVVIWEGPSQLDGTPILAVASRTREASQNGKTGDMIQIAIMRQDVSPGWAYVQGFDGAVCPDDCDHKSVARGGMGTCYVNKVKLRATWERAIRLIEAGEVGAPRGFFTGARVRIGNEGDGAAVPLHVWQGIVAEAADHTAYTAGWRDLGPDWARIFMASVSTPADAIRARSAGWRFFASSGSSADDAAFTEAGGRACLNHSHGLQCVSCLGCDGLKKGKKRLSFWIPFHGVKGSAVRG